MTRREAPIFVVGYQRSGTTLLQSLLGAHPRIASPPETFFIFRVASLHAYFGDLRDDERLRRALHEALNPPVPLFEECGFDEDRIFERLRTSDRSYAAILGAVMHDFAERHGKARWSEKTPGQPASGVYDLFPDAQVLHIVRDPRDVVASSLETPWTPRQPRLIADDWRRFLHDNVRSGLLAGPQQFHQLRYEDLTRDPERVLRAVCAFLNEDFAPQMLDDPSLRKATIAPAATGWQAHALDPVTASRQGRWRNMSPGDQARVGAVVRHEIAALGYEPVPRASAARGLALNAVLRPRELGVRLEERRLRSARRDPVRHYEAVQRYVRRRASTVST